jgi:AraC-like DNA-binding protein
MRPTGWQPDVRFDAVAQLLARPGAPRFADAAAAAGYYDQAHMANHVRRFAGLTPAQLVARRLPHEGGVFDREVHDRDVRSGSSKTRQRSAP